MLRAESSTCALMAAWTRCTTAVSRTLSDTLRRLGQINEDDMLLARAAPEPRN